MKLNESQQQAVNHIDGPLMVVAGAGTGKTTVLTEKVKKLITEGHAKPSEILALTFTEKAAREMEERIDKALPMGYVQTWISTFHSFGEQILRKEALAVGLDPGFELMSEAETQLFMKKHLNEFDLRYFRPLGNPTKFLSGLAVHFSRLKDEDVSPERYQEWVEEQTVGSKQQAESNKQHTAFDEELERYAELAQAYALYEKLKAEAGKMDFGDLIYQTLQLFRTRPDLLQQYREQFRYILVDEYQDTNYAQAELAVLLAGGHQRISVFLDDDQSIYRFRGAAVYNAMDFRQHFPDAHIVVLSDNYRSTQSILDHSYDLITHNNPDRLEVKENINKKLLAARGVGIQPAIIWEERGEDEAESVATRIEELITTQDYDFRDFAILVRANNHADVFTRALSRRGIPFQFLGPGQLYNQPEIRDLLAYFKILTDMADNQAMYRLLVKPHFDIDRRDVAALITWANQENTHLFQSLERLPEAEAPLDISAESVRKMKKLLSILQRHIDRLPDYQPAQLLYYFLEDTGMLKLYQTVDSEKRQKEVLNISRFFEEIRAFETRQKEASVYDWLEYVEFVWQQGESPLASELDWLEVNAVNLLSVHSAKGLEFPVVFLVNLVNARFPTNNRRDQIPIPDALAKESLPDGDVHEQEERRLFYVGMTRAKDYLYLSGAKFYGDNKRPKKLSGFVHEALGEDVSPFIIETNKDIQQLELFGRYAAQEDKNEPLTPVSRKIDYLTYSRINSFQTCPMHYYMQYVLNVPMPPTAPASFGTTVHNTMKLYYQWILAGNKEDLQSTILNIYHQSWVSRGFESKKQEEQMKSQGEEWLKDYIKNEFNPDIMPVELEMPFTFKIGDLKIGGRIDRIDQLKDGSLEIIDYKTGSAKDAKQLKKDLQLAIYAIALLESGRFNQSVENIHLCYYFFETGEKISVDISAERLQEAKDEIVTVREQIEQSDFQCSGNYVCKQGCEYALFCQV